MRAGFDGFLDDVLHLAVVHIIIGPQTVHDVVGDDVNRDAEDVILVAEGQEGEGRSEMVRIRFTIV